MKRGLNFYCRTLVVILSFVSLWLGSSSWAQTKDEFSDFEAELEAPANTPPPAAPQVTAPPPIEEDNLASDEKITHLKKTIRASKKNAGKITDLAEELYKKGEYEKVTLLVWKHIDRIDRQGLLILARSHEKRNEPNEMIRALNVVIGKNDKDFEAYNMLGTAYIMARKNKEGLENYKKSLELNPKYEPTYTSLIDLYGKREPPNLYELRILYQDMIDNIGPRIDYLVKLCEINTLDATYESGIKSCKEAIGKDPSRPDPHVYLAICYKETNQDELAAKALKKAASDFSQSEFAQYQYGHLLEEQKNYVDAIKYFKKGTEVDEKAARSWLGLASSSFEIRKYDISLIAYKNACKYDKKNAVAFRKATTILRNQKNAQWIGKFEEASETCTF